MHCAHSCLIPVARGIAYAIGPDGKQLHRGGLPHWLTHAHMGHNQPPVYRLRQRRRRGTSCHLGDDPKHERHHTADVSNRHPDRLAGFAGSVAAEPNFDSWRCLPCRGTPHKYTDRWRKLVSVCSTRTDCCFGASWGILTASDRSWSSFRVQAVFRCDNLEFFDEVCGLIIRSFLAEIR